MQEIRGSNPRSSTPGKTDKFEILSPRFTGLVQQQNTATQQFDVPLHRPGSGSGTGPGCWHDLLKPHAKMDSERLDQEERCLPPAFATCTGAGAWRVWAGDSCRFSNRSGQAVSCRACLAAGEPSADRRAERWRGMVRRFAPGAASSVSRRRLLCPAAQLGARRRGVGAGQAQRRTGLAAPGAPGSGNDRWAGAGRSP
jgi:hypothetical protein